MKNNKSNKFSLSILLAGILGVAGLSVLLYFVIAQVNKSDTGNPDDGRLNLELQDIDYLAHVKHMDSLTTDEANTIKSGVQENIDEKMASLNLELDTDYTVANMDDIKNGVRLDSINVIVAAVDSSTKARGSLVVTLNGQEDITDRSIPTITIPANQATNGLSVIKARDVLNEIKFQVYEVLTQGQINEEGIDYEIVNLNLIVAGAKFVDYSDKLSVRAIPGTGVPKLVGTFNITFQQGS